MRYFFALFILLNASFTHATFNLPALNTDAQKLAFLLQIKKEIPTLFADAAKYDIDLFRLLDNEAELIALLKKNFIKFDELYSAKKYVKMSMRPLTDIWVGQVEMDPQAVLDWKNSLHNKIDNIRKKFSDPINFQSLGEQLLDFNPVKLLNQIGRIETKNKNELKKLLKLHETSYSMLANCTRNGDMAQKYLCIYDNYHALSDLPQLPSREEIRTIYHRILEEEKTVSLLQIAVIMKYKKIENLAAINASINQLKSEDLLFLKDPDALIPLLSSFFKNKDDPRVDRALMLFQKEIHPFANRTISRTTKISSGLELQEVHATAGIFRGCVGGDCSSQYSFPYPNDPNERVFFIKKQTDKQDPKNKIKGYLSATEVLVHGKKALYIISINGVNISSADTELIFRGLEAAKHQLGVSFIVLPAENKLADLINFPPILEIYANHIKKNKKNSVDIIYQDQDIRAQIQSYAPELGSNYNTATYDHMDRNEQGTILSLNSPHSVETIITELVINRDRESVLEKNDIFEFLVELKISNRKNIIEKILNIDEIINLFQEDKIQEIRNFFSLMDACENAEERMSIDEFEEKSRSLLISLDLDENFFKNYPTLMVPGYFLFTDAFEEQNIEKSAKMLEKRMLKFEIYLEKEEIKNVIRNHLKKLVIFPCFKSLIETNRKKLLLDGNEKISALQFFSVFHELVDEEIFEIVLNNLSAQKSPILHLSIEVLLKTESQDPRVIDTLGECLESGFDLEVLRALLNLGSKDARAIQIWAEYLKRQTDEFIFEKLWDFRTIKDLNLPLLERLVEMLKNKKYRNRQRTIISTLEEIGFGSPLAVEALRGMLGYYMSGHRIYRTLKGWGYDLSWWDTINYYTGQCSLL